MASGIDTVIFDMDGVIFDSEILVLQAWKEVAERHGIAGVEAACHECLGTNSVVSKGVFLKHYGEDFPYEEYKAEMAEVFFSHASGGKLAKKPGVVFFLFFLLCVGFVFPVLLGWYRCWRRFLMVGCWVFLSRLSGEIWWNGVSRNRIFFWRLADDWGPDRRIVM